MVTRQHRPVPKRRATSASTPAGRGIFGNPSRSGAWSRHALPEASRSARPRLAGTKLKNWLNLDDPQGTAGVDLAIRTKTFAFQVSSATKQKLMDAGVYSAYGVARRSAIHFAIGRNRDGTTWTDTDWGGFFTADDGWGADAGRYFLREIRGPEAIVSDLSELTIPEL